jgi:hypothetical protein
MKVTLQGVSSVLKFQRGGWRVSIPILLTPTITPAALLISALVPALVDGFVFSIAQPSMLAQAGMLPTQLCGVACVMSVAYWP